MTKFGHAAALVALFGAVPLQAAPDTGLILHDTGLGHRNTGFGGTIGIRIRLGADHVVKQSERVEIGIAAGPVMILRDSAANDGIRRSQVSLIGVNLKPGYSTSLNLAGTAVATEFTRLGAAEKDDAEKDRNEQSTGDKIGWVALVAGGVMAVLVGAYLSRCGSGEDSPCGSD